MKQFRMLLVLLVGFAGSIAAATKEERIADLQDKAELGVSTPEEDKELRQLQEELAQEK